MMRVLTIVMKRKMTRKIQMRIGMKRRIVMKSQITMMKTIIGIMMTVLKMGMCAIQKIGGSTVRK